MIDPKLRGLLRQGERAARLGKRQAAEDVYRQAVDQFPQSLEAWLGLSRVSSSADERAACLRRVQELDPGLVDAVELSEPPTSVVQGAPTPPPADQSPADSLSAIAAESSRWLQEVTERPHHPAREPELATVEGEPAVAVTTCFRHPDRETTLRCNRCDKPICTECAVNTPVGYRCRDCISEQQGTFYSALWYDYALAAVVALPLAAVTSFLIYSIGWLTIFVAPFAGTVIGEAVRLVTGRRRGRWLPLVVGLWIIAGSLPGAGVWFIRFLTASSSGGLRTVPLGDLFWQVVYLALAVSSAYYRLK